jgi:hypothetical protein
MRPQPVTSCTMPSGVPQRPPDADGREALTLRPLQAAAVNCRIASGLQAEQKVLTLRGQMPRKPASRQPLVLLCY